MLKIELKRQPRPFWYSITFARHTFTGQLLYEWYTVRQPDTAIEHNYTIMHVKDVDIFFVLYQVANFATATSEDCSIAAVYSLEFAKTILGQAVTQMQLELLGHLPETLPPGGQMSAARAIELGERIDRDKTLLNIEEQAEYEQDFDVDPSQFTVSLAPGQG